MTNAAFRRIALSMPQGKESTHMGHPDFRVEGRIFATLFYQDNIEWGMVKLKPEQQRHFVGAKPDVFQPVKGGWGRQGCTQVRLAVADKPSLRSAMFSAWLNAAPQRLVEELHPSTQNRRQRR